MNFGNVRFNEKIQNKIGLNIVAPIGSQFTFYCQYGVSTLQFLCIIIVQEIVNTAVQFCQKWCSVFWFNLLAKELLKCHLGAVKKSYERA